MFVQWQCQCGRSLKVKSEHGGKKLRCPACETVQIVPSEQGTMRTTTDLKKTEPAKTTAERAPRKASAGKSAVRAPGESGKGIAIALAALLLVAGGAAAVWYFGFREEDKPRVAERPERGTGSSKGSGSGPEKDPTKPNQPKSATSAANLELVPADAPGFATVALAEWWNGKHGKRLQQQFAQLDPAKYVKQWIGIAPEEAERVTLFLDQRGEPVTIVSTLSPYDQNEVLASISPNAQQESVNGKEIHGQRFGTSVHCISNRLYVSARSRTLKELLSRQQGPIALKEGPLQTAIGLSDKHFIVVGANSEFSELEKARAELRSAPQLSPPMQAARIFLESKLAYLTFDLTEEMTIDVRLGYADEKAAETALADTDVAVKLARDQLAQFRGSIPPDALPFATPLFNYVDATLRTIAKERKGSNLRLLVLTEKSKMQQVTAALVPAVQKVREAATRVTSSNNLKMMAIAAHNYASVYGGTFPPAAIYGKDGRPLLSWRVAILPYVEQASLYKQFHLNESWNSPHNLKLLPLMPKLYALPGTVPPKPGHTVYQVFTGKGALFEGKKGPHLFRGITDGTSNTLLFVEAAKPVPWTAPQDVPYSANVSPLTQIGKHWAGATMAARCDGSVQAIPQTITEKNLRALITPKGGEVIEPDQ